MMTRKNLMNGALALLAACAIYYAFQWQQPGPSTRVSRRSPAVMGKLVETPNYAITSSTSAPQTKLVADAVESLHAAYIAFFSKSLGPDRVHPKLKLTLYKDQREFKQHNRSAPWAEAYYLAPTCYAYYAEGERNPYHWMIHEATHQLNREVAHLPKQKWIDEGLATYFGTSEIRNHTLLPGTIDEHTYPIWWLAEPSISGDLENDIRDGKLIPLRALISGVGGPDIAQNVNRYYIGYWSLTHFLFHFDNGRYADKYRQLIASGGAIEDFEKIIGPVDRIQVEWYGYRQQQVGTLKGDEVVHVIELEE